jgi:hypothetical protein
MFHLIRFAMTALNAQWMSAILLLDASIFPLIRSAMTEFSARLTNVIRSQDA